METTLWLRVRAQRALCAAAILARAAALIVRRPRLVPVLFNPLSALIAVSRAFTCCAALSRSAFNSAIMSMCSSPGGDCTRYSKLRGSLHQLEQHAQCVIKLTVFRCAESPVHPYSVLMNCNSNRSGSLARSNSTTAALYNSCHVGWGIAASLPGSQGRKREVPGYCASARITLARSSKLVRLTKLAGRIIGNATDPKECGLEICYGKSAYVGVG